MKWDLDESRPARAAQLSLHRVACCLFLKFANSANFAGTVADSHSLCMRDQVSHRHVNIEVPDFPRIAWGGVSLLLSVHYFNEPE